MTAFPIANHWRRLDRGMEIPDPWWVSPLIYLLLVLVAVIDPFGGLLLVAMSIVHALIRPAKAWILAIPLVFIQDFGGATAPWTLLPSLIHASPLLFSGAARARSTRGLPFLVYLGFILVLAWGALIEVIMTVRGATPPSAAISVMVRGAAAPMVWATLGILVGSRLLISRRPIRCEFVRTLGVAFAVSLGVALLQMFVDPFILKSPGFEDGLHPASRLIIPSNFGWPQLTGTFHGPNGIHAIYGLAGAILCAVVPRLRRAAWLLAVILITAGLLSGSRSAMLAGLPFALLQIVIPGARIHMRLLGLLLLIIGSMIFSGSRGVNMSEFVDSRQGEQDEIAEIEAREAELREVVQQGGEAGRLAAEQLERSESYRQELMERLDRNLVRVEGESEQVFQRRANAFRIRAEVGTGRYGSTSDARIGGLEFSAAERWRGQIYNWGLRKMPYTTMVFGGGVGFWTDVLGFTPTGSRSPHNALLEVIGQFGIVGLSFYIVLGVLLGLQVIGRIAVCVAAAQLFMVDYVNGLIQELSLLDANSLTMIFWAALPLVLCGTGVRRGWRRVTFFIPRRTEVAS